MLPQITSFAFLSAYPLSLFFPLTVWSSSSFQQWVTRLQDQYHQDEDETAQITVWLHSADPGRPRHSQAKSRSVCQHCEKKQKNDKRQKKQPPPPKPPRLSGLGGGGCLRFVKVIIIFRNKKYYTTETLKFV